MRLASTLVLLCALGALPACNTAVPATGSDGGPIVGDAGDAGRRVDAHLDVDGEAPVDASAGVDGAASEDAGVDGWSADLGDAWSADLGDAWSADLTDASGADAGAPPLVCPFADALDDALPAQLVRQGGVGVTAAMDMPGCTWRSSAGLADRSTGRAMAIDDRFRIASMTKTFTAAVVLQLVEEGLLHLSDRLDAYVVFPRGAAVTIRQLLAHTSGIYDYYNGPAVMAAYDRVWTRTEVLDVADAQPLAFPPGTNYSYSNTNFSCSVSSSRPSPAISIGRRCARDCSSRSASTTRTSTGKRHCRAASCLATIIAAAATST